VLEYLLPASTVADGTYTLRVQKQAGTAAMPLEVTLLGSGLRPVPGALAPSETSDGRLTYRTDLRIDRTIAVELPPR